jgi:hypothetical protein
VPSLYVCPVENILGLRSGGEAQNVTECTFVLFKCENKHAR